jgi:hypothetical protein
MIAYLIGIIVIIYLLIVSYKIEFMSDDDKITDDDALKNFDVAPDNDGDINNEDEDENEILPDNKTEDEQLKIMENARNNYLPNSNQIAEADISKADAEIIRNKTKEAPFTAWEGLYGMQTMTQSKRFMSQDMRAVPVVKKLPDEMVIFGRSSAEPDYYKAGTEVMPKIVSNHGHSVSIGR